MLQLVLNIAHAGEVKKKKNTTQEKVYFLLMGMFYLGVRGN